MKIKIYWENGDVDFINADESMIKEMFRTEPWTGERWYITTDKNEYFDMTKCRKFKIVKDDEV